jgi:hypothetical protein
MFVDPTARVPTDYRPSRLKQHRFRGQQASGCRSVSQLIESIKPLTTARYAIDELSARARS